MIPPISTRLAEIRPLERTDLPAMAELYEVALGSGARVAHPEIVDFFRRTLFDNPWADTELPSLVALDDQGRLIGCIALEARRLRFNGQVVRCVWSAHLAVEPTARRFGIGGILLRRILKGPQDLTITAAASDVVRRMWATLGGQSLHLEGIYWMRVFRPWRLAAALSGMRRRPRLRAAAWAIATALDAAVAPAAARYLRPTSVTDRAPLLTPNILLQLLPSVTTKLRVFPDYDEQYLDWLFQELGRSKRRGQLVARSVQDPAGRPLGWYVYYLRPGFRSEVLQVAAQRDVGRVFDHLLSHAYSHGSAAIGGRLEPRLVESVTRSKCLLWNRGGMLVHARDPDLLCALRCTDSLMTRLEGDWYVDALD